jgi:two-component system CheB/CheR fusion protein
MSVSEESAREPKMNKDLADAKSEQHQAEGLPLMSPDYVEQEALDEIDNIVPSRGYQMQPMIGLGGSAGSIGALQAFFSEVPPDTGLVFVVVIHLSPEHESILPELLQRCTSMKVVAVTDGVQARPNHVYVIPPGKHLATLDGHLRLTDLQPEKGKRVAVDLFFRTLADTHGPHSVAVVLSGADGDGAIGIKRIKERGGLTIAQDPMEAEHAGMPRSAIATGMVDWVLRVGEMPTRVVDYVTREQQLKLPPEEGPQPAQAPALSTADAEAALRDVLTYLRTRTGRDFSYYKRATIVRRISRRMQVNGVDALPDYLAYIRTHPGEAGALLQDLLISVTNFFRDRECFDALEERIPQLFEGKGPNDTVRVWVAACATGEEAYSVAILLSEYARRLDVPPIIQVFATDLDEEAVQMGRDGVYPETITADVSEERLRKFFIKEHRGYRVRREVRELVLFAMHDLLKDSPFSRLDLVCCRNLMIYLNREAQNRLLETFHFALRGDGRLFLGSSESVDEGSHHFEVLDKKHRIYRRQNSGRAILPMPMGPSAIARSLEERARFQDRPIIPGSPGSPHASVAPFPRRGEFPEPSAASWGEMHYKLIERLAPPSVLVNQDYDIMHLSENAGRFLQISGGEPTRNLLRCVDPMLRVDLRAALYQASQSGERTDVFQVPIESNGERTVVSLSVVPAPELAPDCLLVLFRAHEPTGAEETNTTRAEPDPAARQLERELEGMKSHLRDIVEQYEASTEELKASNEELQAMNEELRSATEELETSREELQSINEELTTVNQELKNKVDELGHANSDLRNLIGATAIATIFLDRQLRITRYTPTAVALFKFIPSDVGRPLSDLKHRLDYTTLDHDAANVLDTLQPSEREVRDAEGKWYIARMLPYRTVDDHIGGVVLTLLDITQRKHAEEELRGSEDRFRLIIESAREYAIFTADLKRRVTSWNSGAERMLGYSEAEIIGKSGDIIFTEEDRSQGAPGREAEKATSEGRATNERWHLRKDGTRFWGSGLMMPLRDAKGEPIGLVKIFRDQTEERTAQQALEESRREAEAANQAKDRFLALLSHELRTPLTPILMAAVTVAEEEGLSQESREAMEMIERNIRLECSLIDDLLDVTRIGRAKMEIKKATLDAHEAIQKAVEICRTGIGAKKQKLIVSLDAKRHTLKGDLTRLQQVFWNLLQNASKFTPEKGTLEVHSRNEGDALVVEIKDNGIGIAPEAFPCIFDAFAQADASISKKYGGLGLGLAISKACVEGHGGSLAVASDGPRKGATFTVTLPTK